MDIQLNILIGTRELLMITELIFISTVPKYYQLVSGIDKFAIKEVTTAGIPLGDETFHSVNFGYE